MKIHFQPWSANVAACGSNANSGFASNLTKDAALVTCARCQKSSEFPAQGETK